MNWKRDLSGIYVIWYREILRFWREKARIVTSLIQPVVWLFIMGTGFGSTFGNSLGVDYRQFLFPGVLGMTILFTSLFSGISVVWDREFGFLREILVAPVSRLAIVIGKALGGSTTAMLQGSLILLMAPLIEIRLSFFTFIISLSLMFLISFTLASAGLLVASRMESMQGFQLLMNFVVMPMFFLSGAFFPLTGLPGWLKSLSIIDPLTYGVDALKAATLGVSEFSLGQDIVVIFVLGVIFLTGAAMMFNTEG